MDAWIVIIAIAFAVWWISNNKIRSTSKTKVIETSEFDILLAVNDEDSYCD